MELFVYQLIIVVLLVLLLKPKCSEGLVSKPTQKDIQKYSKDILVNREVFDNGTFYQAREKIPWLDPIIYEEARLLSTKNNLNNISVKTIFHA